MYVWCGHVRNALSIALPLHFFFCGQRNYKAIIFTLLCLNVCEAMRALQLINGDEFDLSQRLRLFQTFRPVSHTFFAAAQKKKISHIIDHNNARANRQQLWTIKSTCIFNAKYSAATTSASTKFLYWHTMVAMVATNEIQWKSAFVVVQVSTAATAAIWESNERRRQQHHQQEVIRKKYNAGA